MTIDENTKSPLNKIPLRGKMVKFIGDKNNDFELEIGKEYEVINHYQEYGLISINSLGNNIFPLSIFSCRELALSSLLDGDEDVGGRCTNWEFLKNFGVSENNYYKKYKYDDLAYIVIDQNKKKEDRYEIIKIKIISDPIDGENGWLYNYSIESSNFDFTEIQKFRENAPQYEIFNTIKEALDDVITKLNNKIELKQIDYLNKKYESQII